ncbi:GntR family transcriptional regulator [Rhodococcus sp. NPDC003382]|uniref:GntR family transcriptional regulator n=1 Tax=unclassified Rhodococcus (in: high G+C Gram-positive bacteria) TaxID=192944 RepID=UPI0018CEB3E7|nr:MULTISPECIES: GntR family transcriptional regulator [unclassified Rhodococcus (in: high G+C Gram-positive bacteria)]MBH0123222.1 GntR family transcriptional regulator [Rhodococcus sp. CX]MCK8671757.1 GntR family transcriptional regulator [Rhodococcus sp. HM1]
MAAPTRTSRGTGSARRPQLSDEVAAHLRGSIMSGELRPGDFVRLDETASDLGVSVTPVREALLTLRGEGMVESVPNRGYVVAPFGSGDVADVFWLQGRIAVELALRVVDRAKEADLDRLDELNQALAAAVSSSRGGDPDVERIADAEFVFHRELNRLAHSPKLAWFLGSAARNTPYRLYAGDIGWGERAVESHRRLIAALRTRDRDAVRGETLSLFDDAAKRLVTHLERVGFGSAE